MKTLSGALAALLCGFVGAGTAHAQADAKTIAKCSSAIIKAGAAYVQAEAKALQKCRETDLKGGKKPCDQTKTTDAITKAQAKLTSSITKGCQAKDLSCTTTLADIDWPSACPGFEGGCTAAINSCTDIHTCVQCISDASVNQAINLYYPSGRPPSAPDKALKALNKCQVAIGKSAATFLAAESKALSKCWGTKVKKPATVCPDDAQDAITKARGKLTSSIAKACPAPLDNSTIGMAGNCLPVSPPGGASCTATVSAVADISTCLGCATDFKVACNDRLAGQSAGAAYPNECLTPVPTPTPTATATVTATPTVTATGVATVTPTETASPTPSVTPTPPSTCGNGVLDGGEKCDASAGVTTCTNTGPGFPCNSFCTCDCPTMVAFAGDAADPATILDTGWTGIAHRTPVITNGDVTVAVSGCENPAGRDCGVCNISGPIDNPGADNGQLNDRRCSNDTSIKCTSNAPCTAGGGTCQFFFGSILSLSAGGVSTCVVNQFNGPVTGTANVESGEAVTIAHLTSTVFNGISIDTPCPTCVGDGTENDGHADGTCVGGTRNGQACDANGTIPGRPDFGETSLDCPVAGGPIAVLPIDLSNSTGTVARTLTVNSPNCTAAGYGAFKCLCDTCNNGNSDPCTSNADCPVSGGQPGICGGRRCRGGDDDGQPCPGAFSTCAGGANAGNVCTSSTQCPGSSCTLCPGTPAGTCGRAGEPTAPNPCIDDSSTPGIDESQCMDTAPVGDNAGVCLTNPSSQFCSNHPQRGCTGATEVHDCGAPGTCTLKQRPCFLDNGQVGNAIVATGMADVPVNDVSNPTLGAVFCIGPTSGEAVNSVAGLPGPGRVTLKGTAVGLP